MISERDKRLSDVVAKLLYKERHSEAAELIVNVLEIPGVTFDGDNPENYQPVLQNWLHHLLNNGGQTEAARMLWTPTQFNPDPSFSKQVWDLYDEATFGLIMGGASVSKCLGGNELCRMEDGSKRRAKDIVPGDRLAGFCGPARTVLHTASGESEMFEISPDGIPTFRCNADHVLTLICTWERRNHGGDGCVSSGYTPGKIVDVPLREYLTWGALRKRAYRLFVAPAVMPAQPVKVDPYIYGAGLGDGTRSGGHAPDAFRAAYIYGSWLGDGTRARFRRALDGKDKRIRPEYLVNSEENRLKLLAGLIDSDGCAVGTGYDIVTKWPGLADDIEELARSLGFKVTRTVRKHGIKKLNITGRCEKIPTLEKRPRRISDRETTAGFATCRFSVRSAGLGDYAGFTLDGDHRFLLGSGVVTHNSFTMGVRLVLEYIRDPEWTNISVVGPSEDHLQRNLFTHLVNLHQRANLPLPGSVGELFIGTNRRSQVGSIKGLIIPVGKTKQAGRLKGTKRYPRRQPHPIFGELSRFFVFVDEIENVPQGIWADVGNIMSQVSVEHKDGFKIFGAYNPSNMADEVAKRAEPTFGWADFDLDVHYKWVSQRGWHVLRLDGEKCENVVQGKEIYNGLQTREGLAQLALESGGRDTAGYYTMGRGAYPPMGTKLSVFPPGMLAKCRGEFIWYETPQPLGSTDLALEGGASAVYSLGAFGLASGYSEPPSIDYPIGRTVMFKDSAGNVTPRVALQVSGQFTLPKGSTIPMTKSVIDMNHKCGVRAGWYGCDRTGHGQGVADLVTHEFGQIFAVNYSESPTETKVCEEDTKTCKERFHRIDSELWFAARAWFEFGYVKIHPSIDLSKLHQQLGNRMYRQQAGKTRVEPKSDYVGRGYESPDEADSLTLLVHVARQAAAVVLSMKSGSAAPSAAGWFDSSFPDEFFIDATNQSDTLDLQPSEIMGEIL